MRCQVLFTNAFTTTKNMGGRMGLTLGVTGEKCPFKEARKNLRNIFKSNNLIFLRQIDKPVHSSQLQIRFKN